MALKFAFRLKSALITPIYTESYSTVYRAIALAVLGSCGRLISALAPFVIFKISGAINYNRIIFISNPSH